jgi:hypothetical protein
MIIQRVSEVVLVSAIIDFINQFQELNLHDKFLILLIPLAPILIAISLFTKHRDFKRSIESQLDNAKQLREQTEKHNK